MKEERKKIDNAQASPSKEFFVKMLTRDIDMQDALLDLLDNCIDGIVRSGAKSQVASSAYKGFWAKIVLNKDHFVIEDNCGGIPYKIAKERAFALGRPPSVKDASSVVGIYGIGMKRAIFKLGMEAVVETRNDTGLTVIIDKDWIMEDEWKELPMFDLADTKLSEKGTRIEVHQLNREASALFESKAWIDSFKSMIGQHYSIIIEKGFNVYCSMQEKDIDKEKIVAQAFSLLQTPASDSHNRIAPLMYRGTLDGVNVSIFAGIYRELLSEEEMEEEEDTRGVKDDAGWTVACNDRVVIWKDKTRLTGWGEATVPNYHGQFIAITGIVLLDSNDIRKLPLTTTKRGIDASSDVYLQTKEFMREATKLLTSFTNKWKKFPKQREALYKASRYVGLDELKTALADTSMQKSRKFADMSKFEPAYPEPRELTTSARIVYSALKSDIALVSDYFFAELKVKNGQVGEAAFQDVLERVKKS